MEDFIELPDGEGLEDVERLRLSLLAVCDAVKMMLVKLVELDEHTATHHEVINAHSTAIAMLEDLMIGGSNEAPTA